MTSATADTARRKDDEQAQSSRDARHASPRHGTREHASESMQHEHVQHKLREAIHISNDIKSHMAKYTGVRVPESQPLPAPDEGTQALPPADPASTIRATSPMEPYASAANPKPPPTHPASLTSPPGSPLEPSSSPTAPTIPHAGPVRIPSGVLLCSPSKSGTAGTVMEDTTLMSSVPGGPLPETVTAVKAAPHPVTHGHASPALSTAQPVLAVDNALEAALAGSAGLEGTHVGTGAAGHSFQPPTAAQHMPGVTHPSASPHHHHQPLQPTSNQPVAHAPVVVHHQEQQQEHSGGGVMASAKAVAGRLMAPFVASAGGTDRDTVHAMERLATLEDTGSSVAPTIDPGSRALGDPHAVGGPAPIPHTAPAPPEAGGPVRYRPAPITGTITDLVYHFGRAVVTAGRWLVKGAPPSPAVAPAAAPPAPPRITAPPATTTPAVEHEPGADALAAVGAEGEGKQRPGGLVAGVISPDTAGAAAVAARIVAQQVSAALHAPRKPHEAVEGASEALVGDEKHPGVLGTLVSGFESLIHPATPHLELPTDVTTTPPTHGFAATALPEVQQAERMPHAVPAERGVLLGADPTIAELHVPEGARAPGAHADTLDPGAPAAPLHGFAAAAVPEVQQLDWAA